MSLLRDPTDPGAMTADSRDREVAEILARGYLRSRELLRDQALSTTSGPAADPGAEVSEPASNELDDSAQTERACPHG